MAEKPEKEDGASAVTTPTPERRSVLLGAAMTGGLVASYGAFAAYAGRFLYGAGSRAATSWMYLIEVARMKPGDSMKFVTPGGAKVAVARQGSSGTVDDFVALSSTCPHLGCQVHWEPQHERFFCPCHNGTFDRSGRATSGPPFEAKQSLPRYPLRVENGLLFIEVPAESLSMNDGNGQAPDGCVVLRRKA